MSSRTHTYVRTYTFRYTQTFTHAHEYKHIHIHMYMYKQVPVRTSEYVNRGEQDGECAQPLSRRLEEYNIEKKNERAVCISQSVIEEKGR